MQDTVDAGFSRRKLRLADALVVALARDGSHGVLVLLLRSFIGDTNLVPLLVVQHD